MSDPNELPDYDYADDDKEEAKNHDADGKKYVKLHFLHSSQLFHLRADGQKLNRPLII